MLLRSRPAGRPTTAPVFAEIKPMKFSSVPLAILSLCATAPALAADLGAVPYGQAPAFAAPIYNWTGFYIGGHVGGGISSNEALNGIVTNNQSGRLLGGGAARRHHPVWQ